MSQIPIKELIPREELMASGHLACPGCGGSLAMRLVLKTRTEFMIESARKLAIDVLLDQRLFVLDPERYDAFVHALDNPPAPGPKLRSLLRRAPAWES